jgi:hypothetical protein
VVNWISSKFNKTFWQRYWIYLIPLLLCSLVMLPRLLDPHFGLMDDGDFFQKAHQIGNGEWGPGSEVGAGRFRPMYWYIHYLLFLVFNDNPTGYFIVNYLVFALLIVGVVRLLKVYGSANAAILVSAVLFISSGPIAESYYTLSKYEIFQALFIIAAMLTAERLKHTVRTSTKILLGIGVFVFTLISFLIKETSLVMLVIYGGWLIIFFIRYRADKPRVRSWIVAAAAVILAGILFFLWRGYYFSEVLSQGSYVDNHINLSLGFLKESIYGWYPWLKRDFSYCLVLFLFFTIILVIQRKKPRYLDIYLGAIIWMVGWLGVFLPWMIKIEYYLLPFSLGCCVLAGHLLMELVDGFVKGMIWKRLIVLFGLGTASGFLVISLLFTINNARYQLLMDQVNTRMLAYLAETLPVNGMVFVNLPADNEYVKEIELHLKYIYHRPDVNVSRFNFQTTDMNGILPEAYIISPVVTNRPVYSTRHAFNQDDSTAWTYSIERYMADDVGEPVILSSSFVQLVPHFFRFACPLFPNYQSCVTDPRILEMTPLTYQWSIYRYVRSSKDADDPGVYRCGIWNLRQVDGLEFTKMFGGCEDTPIVADWNGDGTSDLGIYTPGTNEWQIDSDSDGQADIQFTLDRMVAGDIPLVGDWDGDGRDTPGTFRPSTQEWELYEGVAGSYRLTFSTKGGTATSIPLVGDWNRDSIDTWGIYVPETGGVNLEDEFSSDLAGVDFQLQANSRVIAADWYGTGRDTLAFIDQTDWIIFPANCGCIYPNLLPRYRYPIDDGIPVSGRWH